MADKKRVPVKDDEFNTYLTETTTYGLGVRSGTVIFNLLGLTDPEKAIWVGYRDAWLDKFGIVKTQKEQGIRNATSIAEKNKVKEDFTDWVTDPEFNKLNRIGSSPNVIEQDRNVFHIALRDETRTVQTAPIAAEMFFSMKPISGGDMRVRCRQDEDSTRASIPDEANALELRWKVGADAPNSVDDCPNKENFTEALFTHNFGAGNTAKKIFAYARWTDNTNKNRSGPWSDMVQTVIV